MRALVLLALAAAAAAGADSDSEVTVNVGTDDEERAVKDAAKLRAALAKGDLVIYLWEDILLDGAPAVATHDAVIEGNNYMIYQTTGARHFVANGTRLELKNLQLKTGGHPSPAPTWGDVVFSGTAGASSGAAAILSEVASPAAGVTTADTESQRAP